LNNTPYASLTPDLVLDAVSACGLWPDGRLLALNSYENRVWQVGIERVGSEPAAPVIAKFYRPGRWSDAAIIEEHAFAQELADAELPVVAPLVFDGRSLLHHGGFRYALSPRRGGRAPELEAVDQLQWLGRLIARMHVIGARARFVHRGRLDRDTMVQQPMRAVLDSSLLPLALQTN
jgi:Ser/Thr protein kinase RdoA (MazF antagonist)